MGRIPRHGILGHATRLASDQADPEAIGASHILQIVTTALSKLDDDQKQQLIEGLSQIIQNGASDEGGPSAFPGRPNPGGKLDPPRTAAMDRQFYERFPDIKRIGLKGGFGA